MRSHTPAGTVRHLRTGHDEERPTLCYLHHAGGLPLPPPALRAGFAPTGSVRALSLKDASEDSIESYARAVIPQLQEIASHRGPVVLYGHSMGGLVAYECCRLLRRGSRDEQGVGHLSYVVRSLVLAACAPMWIVGDQVDTSAMRRGSQRTFRHLEAVTHYRPSRADDPLVPVHVVFADGDQVVPPAAARTWASLGWQSVVIHRWNTDDHLFHVRGTADAVEKAQWAGLLESVLASSYPGRSFDA